MLQTTVNCDLCINCGICKFVCPDNAIVMKRNKYGELNPYIEKSKCLVCGICTFFCPNTKEKLQQEAQKVSSIASPHTYGLQNASYYLAWMRNKENRQKSCSGGAVTQLAAHLLNIGQIDGLIHVERQWGHRGDFHYRARLSCTLEDICGNTSSAYQPIDFSEILPHLSDNRTYMVCGTPCVIRGLKSLFRDHKNFSGIKIITCALVCSHNTNSHIIDYLTEINNVCDEEKWQINIRHKDNSIIDANNYLNHIYTQNKVLLCKNRFESGWTEIWRSYYFSMNACLYCSDFWGYEADISVKDAWGKWAEDPLGKSIVIIRNKELDFYFRNSGLEVEPLSYEVMEKHQKPTAVFKQTEAFNKNFKSLFCRRNRKNGLLRYKIISKVSKFLYRNTGYKTTRFCMKLIDKILKRVTKL